MRCLVAVAIAVPFVRLCGFGGQLLLEVGEELKRRADSPLRRFQLRPCRFDRRLKMLTVAHNPPYRLPACQTGRVHLVGYLRDSFHVTVPGGLAPPGTVVEIDAGWTGISAQTGSLVRAEGAWVRRGWRRRTVFVVDRFSLTDPPL